jgi:predicted transcriptional regulator of viral defense system
MESRETARERAATVFRDSGGTLRMGEVLRRGVSRHMLYSMVADGSLERLSRGVYRLAELDPIANPDLVTVAQRMPGGVICLISALAFHRLTTQIPHVVWVAIRRGAWAPRLDWPPVRVMEYAEPAYSAGVEVHDLDGVRVRIYSPEKTLADHFKYRNRIGLDIALEGLRLYIGSGHPKIDELLSMARICRVEKTMMPYVEALL